MDTINAIAGVAPPPAPVAVRTDATVPMSLPQTKKIRHPKHKKEHNGQHGKSKRRRNNLKQPLTKDMPRIMSDLLKEPKVALLHRVVKHVGPKVSWQILRETLRLEKDGGQTVNALASGKPELFFVVDEVSHEYKPRRRTSGGVFFTLLKEKVSKEVYRTIYEVEDRKKKDAKKRARNRQRQRMDNTLTKLGFDELSLKPGGEDPVSGDEAGAPVAPVERTTESEAMQVS
ncbi:Phosphorylated adapter RNA export protein [Phytophthora citrophthora]|uniref:Phosphorylated adapter RNA export protein n=1 Tax=Phytophthora citrophthora TaxID=4793 RepID=A0AAD9GQJ6_9STRA|nr:Phosphorylated adapter RNA export protein [Phytophthora citrophthora]